MREQAKRVSLATILVAIQIVGGTIVIMTMPFVLSRSDPSRSFFVGAAKYVLLVANYFVGIGLHRLATRFRKRNQGETNVGRD